MNDVITTEKKIDALVNYFKTNISGDDELSKIFNKVLKLVTTNETVKVYAGLKDVIECCQIMLEELDETFDFSEEGI